MSAEFIVAKAARTQARRNATTDLKLAPQFATILDATLKPASLYEAKLKQHCADLANLDKVVMEGLSSDEPALEADIQRSMQYQTDLQAAISELAFNISVFKAQQQTSVAQAIATASPQPFLVDPQPRGARHRLLDVDVIKFHGDHAKWDEFWDDFLATVDSKAQYTKQEKLKILKGSLEGEARGMVQNFSLTEANYEQAKQALEERYANKQLRRFAHLEALLAVSAAEHNTGKLRSMFDQCEAHIRSLVALGLTEDKFGEVFVPILLSKLPKFVRMEVTRKNGKQDWTLANLRTLLREEIDVRDTCERTAWGTQEGPSKSKGQRFKNNNSTATASALVISQDAKGKAKESPQCAFCSKAHESHSCNTYTDPASRLDHLGRACISCLQVGHFKRNCKRKSDCPHCGKKGHHKSLCRMKYPSETHRAEKFRHATDESVQVVDCRETAPAARSVANVLGVAASGKRDGRAILETAVASVKGTKSTVKARLIFDCASTLSFITTSMAKQVGAKSLGEETSSVGRFRDRKRCTSTYQLYEVEVKLADGSWKRIVVNGVAAISSSVQLVPLAPQHRELLSTLSLAEPVLDSPKTVTIDILIGLDSYHSFVEESQIRLTDELVMKKSVLGWMASGFQRGQSQGLEHTHVILRVDAQKGDMFDIERFWALHEIGIRDDPGSVDDEVALKYFNDTITFENGRYQVKWPFKEPNPNLPNNRRLALCRLKSLWSKLKDQPNTLSAYDHVIKDQLAKGIIEEAPPVPDGLEHYLPHHCVVKETSATTKLRVVYDASAKKDRDSLSLNDCLYRGPVLMCDLVGILLRSRLHPIGLLSDIEKAYLQVGLQTEDRDVTRFFWFREVTKGFAASNIVCFRFCRVVFGVRPSVFMLSGTVMAHVRKSKRLVARELEQNMYVDNVFKGKSDLKSALQFYREAKGLLAEASMNPREWFSNSEEFMSSIPEVDRGKGKTTQLLGLRWDVQKDVLFSQPKLKDVAQPATKRQVLKTIASVYDPCGWFCPIVMPGKVLMQKLWIRKIEWDQPIPDELRGTWNEIWRNLQKIEEFGIPRCVDRRTPDSDTTIELHAFCDASARAYGAVVYIRVSRSNQTTVNQMFAKGRVCPLKRNSGKNMTIPRLELVGVVVGLRILSLVASEIHLPIKRQFVWTDSKCVLHWIPSQTVQTKFVENRLSEIRKSVGLVDFRFVPTSDNPADIPTRGTDAETLKSCSLWWNGPSWLLESDETWPPNIELSDKVAASVVVQPEETLVALVDEPPPTIDMKRFGSLTRLLRVTTWVFRALKRFKGQAIGASLLLATELQAAEAYWIELIQRQYLPELFGQNGPSDNRNLKRQLGLYRGLDGLVRCRGRFEHAQLSEEEKHPIFLPRHHPFTDLVVKRAHTRVLHSGVGNTLAEVRSRYWVPQGRAKVKQVIRSCPVCQRTDGGPFRVPDAPALPVERVTQSSPFSFVGVDYAGPLFVKTGEGNSKVWIVLFTCAVVRAIHLEVAESLSAYDFLLCLRRFVAARGVPQVMISDNAKQFVLSSQLLAKSWMQLAKHETVADYCADVGIEWKFVPETAAWMGGFYERLVKPVKETMKKSLGIRSVTLKELNALMPEIAAMINSRPLTYLESDVGDMPLRPLDFLRTPANVLAISPDANLSLGRRPTARGLKELFEVGRKQLNRCWQQWRSRYLLSLREHVARHNNFNSSSMEPKVGAVVLLKDALPRLKWRIGKITNLRMSRDGKCRSVDLRLGNGNTVVRPIKSLFPLECSIDDTPPQDNVLRQHLQAADMRKVRAPVEEQGYSSDEGSVEY